MTGEAYAGLPDTITVREFSVKGRVYVTTLLEAKKYPKTAIATFYQHRWHIELDIRAIKTHRGLGVTKV
jgi:IS4 transposase